MVVLELRLLTTWPHSRMLQKRRRKDKGEDEDQAASCDCVLCLPLLCGEWSGQHYLIALCTLCTMQDRIYLAGQDEQPVLA